MSNNNKTILRFKKGQFESVTDNYAGLIVFDDLLKTIYLEGQEYGPLSNYKLSAIIDENSTSNEIPTTKAVYETINNSIQKFFDNLTQEELELVNSYTTRIPAPKVIIDEENDSVSNINIQANTVYIYLQPLIKFTVDNIVNSPLETTIYFTVGSEDFEFTIPQGLMAINQLLFDKDKHYVISIQNGVIVAEVMNSYVNTENFIYNSSQLQGGYIEAPTIFENVDNNPVINNVQPNAIYKFGVCDTITLNNIPSNSLETIVYWTSEENTSLYLTGDNNTILKITDGSTKVFRNNNYTMCIKDGNIAISSMSKI